MSVVLASLSTVTHSSTVSWLVHDGTDQDGSAFWEDKQQVTRIVFSPDIERVGVFAALHCRSLVEVELPEGVLEIGRSAFCHSGVENVRLPGSLKVIGNLAFANCCQLRSLRLPSGLEELGGCCFGGDSSLTSLNMPASVRRFGDHVFTGCNRLVPFDIDVRDSPFGSEDNTMRVAAYLRARPSYAMLAILARVRAAERVVSTIPPNWSSAWGSNRPFYSSLLSSVAPTPALSTDLEDAPAPIERGAWGLNKALMRWLCENETMCRVVLSYL